MYLTALCVRALAALSVKFIISSARFHLENASFMIFVDLKDKRDVLLSL